VSTSNPTQLAKRYFEEASHAVEACKGTPRVLGLIASTDKPSMAYANATKQRFLDVGMEYTLEQVGRLDLEARILEANEDSRIHGVFIYFPVFGNQQDDYLRNLISFTKDIEAGSQYWVRKLYANDRLAVDGDPTRKAVLPCTPLAIVKLLVELSVYGDPSIKPGPSAKPLAGQTVTIFNRSEVIGRPLAVMMSNDGAEVLSFDETGRSNSWPQDLRNALFRDKRRLYAQTLSSQVSHQTPFTQSKRQRLKRAVLVLTFPVFPTLLTLRPTRRHSLYPELAP